VSRCQEIVANVRMEECYAGMSLVFEAQREDLKEAIEHAIEAVSEKTGLKPLIFDNAKTNKSNNEAYYLEFSDEVQRESGAYFELILKTLGIDKCENDVIKGEK